MGLDSARVIGWAKGLGQARSKETVKGLDSDSARVTGRATGLG